MEWTPASGEQKRHNVAVITVGSRYYSLYSISSILSHATLEQPFRTLSNKVRGCWRSLPASSFMHLSLSLCRCQIKWEVVVMSLSNKVRGCWRSLPASSFMHLSLSLCRCELFYIYMCMYVDVNLHMWLYNTLTEPSIRDAPVWISGRRSHELIRSKWALWNNI